LRIKDGEFKGAVAPNKGTIAFTTAEYSGTGNVYYAVVTANAPALGYSAYTLLDTLIANRHGKTVQLPGPASNNYDMYVLVMKGGEISVPIVINTTSGGQSGGWLWDGNPHLVLYVT
jgi:hypothetical protein